MKKISLLSLLTVMAVSTAASAHVEDPLYMPAKGRLYSVTEVSKADKNYGLYETIGYGITDRFAIDGTVNHLWVHEEEDGFGSFKFGGKYRLSTAGLITDVYASYETDIDEDVIGDFSSIEAGLKFGKMTNKWTLAGKLAYNNIDVDGDDTNNFIIGAEGLYNFDDRISGQLGIDYTLVDKSSFNTEDEDSIALTAQVNYLRGGLWSLYYTTELKADDVDDQIGFKYGIQF